jgi:cytochrome d ubiquinol oxidase subunit II
MDLADVVAAVMFVGITLYALLAGADFGAGFWDLAAGSTKRGAPARALIEESIAPVWEANHVWLIFVLVVLWTGFPSAFAPIMSTLYIPLTGAAFGIILRGSGFAFRKASTTLSSQRLFGATFALSSVLTPYFLGAVVGGVASARVPAGDETGNVVTSWCNPTSVLGGVMAVVVCAFLASVFLAADARRHGREQLADAFRRRALASGVVAGAVALAGVFVLHADAPDLFDGLTGRGAVLIVVSALAGVATLVFVARGRFDVARYAGALAVVAVLWGWAAAQYPWLLIDHLKIDDGAGAHATLVAMLVVIGVGTLLLLPPLVWLIVLTQRGALTAHDDGHGEAHAATAP